VLTLEWISVSIEVGELVDAAERGVEV